MHIHEAFHIEKIKKNMKPIQLSHNLEGGEGEKSLCPNCVFSTIRILQFLCKVQNVFSNRDKKETPKSIVV